MSSEPGKLMPGSNRERTIIGFCLSITGILLLIDQISKTYVAATFSFGESRSVIDGFFAFTYVTNKGAAWSILEGKVWFLVFIALIVIGIVVWFFRQLTDGYIERYFGVAIAMAGVLGNTIDRIWRGEVVDFFDCYIRFGGVERHWPIFNVADIAICVGIGLFILSNIVRHRKSDKKIEKSNINGIVAEESEVEEITSNEPIVNESVTEDTSSKEPISDKSATL